MKKFFLFFVLLYTFLFHSINAVEYFDNLTYQKQVNKCLNTVTDDTIKQICKRYKLNLAEYNKVFSKSYFDNLEVPNFIILTTPKTGTHLLQKTIALMLGKQPLFGHQVNVDLDSWRQLLCTNISEYPFSHLLSNKNYDFCINQDFKIITIKRDLRDHIVSSIFAQDIIDKAKGVYIDLPIKEKLKQKMSTFMNNNTFFLGCNTLCEIRRVNNLGLLIKFENLIGPKGKGDLKLQKSEIRKIAKYLNITLNNNQINYICNNLWGNTMSFRKGEIGDWKNYFTEEIKEEFIKRGGGTILIEEGYEKDYNW